jgi:hypothetical protein
LRQVKARQQAAGVSGARFYEVIWTMTVSQGSQRIDRLCRLAGVSRAGYYRFWRTSAPRQHDTALRSAIQRITLAIGRHRGCRYITHQLRREDGIIANHR